MFNKREKIKPTTASPVVVVAQPVVEDPVDFVEPETHQFLRGAEGTVGHEQDARDDAGEVAEVEDVVALGRRGQEGGRRSLVHLPRRLHHRLGEKCERKVL